MTNPLFPFWWPFQPGPSADAPAPCGVGGGNPFAAPFEAWQSAMAEATQHWWQAMAAMPFAALGMKMPHITISETPDGLEATATMPDGDARTVSVRVREGTMTIGGREHPVTTIVGRGENVFLGMMVAGFPGFGMALPRMAPEAHDVIEGPPPERTLPRK